MRVNGSKKVYMKVYEALWWYWMLMMVYGCICARMDVYESIWSYMNVNGSKLMYKKVYDAVWWYMNAYESVWMYMSKDDGI